MLEKDLCETCTKNISICDARDITFTFDIDQFSDNPGFVVLCDYYIEEK